MSFGLEVLDASGKATLKVDDTTWFLRSFDRVSRYVQGNPGYTFDIPVSAGGRPIVVLNVSGEKSGWYAAASIRVSTHTNLIRLTITSDGRCTYYVEYTIL